MEGPLCSRVCAVNQVPSAPSSSFSGSSEFMGQDLFVSISMLACERRGNSILLLVDKNPRCTVQLPPVSPSALGITHLWQGLLSAQPVLPSILPITCWEQRNFYFRLPCFPCAASPAAQTTGAGSWLCQKKSINLRERRRTPGINAIHHCQGQGTGHCHHLPGDPAGKQRSGTLLPQPMEAELSLL